MPRKFKGLLILFCVICILSCAVGCGLDSPEAEFTVNSTAGIAPMSVWFTDLSMGEIDSWEWDFDNDGVADSTDQYALYVYKTPGNYTVRLTIGGDGGTDSAIKSSYIVVSPPACKADFSAEPLECQGPTKVQFTDLSVGNVTGWAWDLDGDGDVDSTAQNPAYTYSRNGIYTITLTVTAADCSDTITKHDYISVSGCGG